MPFFYFTLPRRFAESMAYSLSCQVFFVRPLSLCFQIVTALRDYRKMDKVLIICLLIYITLLAHSNDFYYMFVCVCVCESRASARTCESSNRMCAARAHTQTYFMHARLACSVHIYLHIQYLYYFMYINPLQQCIM